MGALVEGEADGLNLIVTQGIQKKMQALVLSNPAKSKTPDFEDLSLKYWPFNHLFTLIVPF